MTDNKGVKYTYDTIKTDPRYAPIGDRVLFLEARVAQLEEFVAVLFGNADPTHNEKLRKHLERAMKITGEKK
jgi:hypothetical protein